jgi:hypothetical protein
VRPWCFTKQVCKKLFAVLSHKNKLESRDLIRYPRFESFAGFSALKRLGLDFDTIPAQIPLVPSSHSISITNCSGAKQSPTVLRRIIEELSVKCIQVDCARTAELLYSWRSPKEQIYLVGLGGYAGSLTNFEILLHRLPWTRGCRRKTVPHVSPQ